MKLSIPLAVTALMLAGCGQEQTTSTPPQSSETSTAVLTAAGEQTVELSCATCIYNSTVDLPFGTYWRGYSRGTPTSSGRTTHCPRCRDDRGKFR